MDSKSIFLSKTFWGLLLSVLSPIAAKHGVSLDADGLSNDVVTAAGAALAIYGRVKASTPVHVVPK